MTRKSAARRHPPGPSASSRAASRRGEGPRRRSGRSAQGEDEVRTSTLRRELLDRQERLHGAMRRTMDDLADSDERFRPPGPDEMPADVDGGDLTMHVLDRESRELEQIEWALQRLTEGSYGQCEACAEPIGLARLEALPLATTCIACARASER